MQSAKKYIVWVSRELAIELLDSGIASSIFEFAIRDPSRDSNYGYAWYIDRSDIHVFIQSKPRELQEELARVLMLIPTQEAREIYLDELWRE